MGSVDSPAARLDLGALIGRHFDAVLFDMDGTLIDSHAGSEAAWRVWAAEQDVDVARVSGIAGRPAAEVVRDVLAADRVAAALARIEQLEIDASHQGIEVLAGTARALGDIPAERIAIVTSCTRALLAARLAASRLRHPEQIVTIDDVEHGKPAPDPFLEGARRLGFEPARCLVVEDAPSGLTAGRGAGCTTLAVGHTHHHSDLDADAWTPDLEHVRFTARPEGIAVSPA
jgi:mannitol-1-/sugar-/sorbitol-6-phosphatase